MAVPLGALKSDHGVTLVCVADKDRLETIRVGRVSVVLISGNSQAKDFFRDQAGEGGLDALVSSSKSAIGNSAGSGYEFEVMAAEHANNSYSCCLLAARNGDLKTIIVKPVYFHGPDDLARYAIMPAYSRHMSPEEVEGLLFYVLLQYMNVFNLAAEFEAITMSPDGHRILDPGEANSAILKQDRVDQKIRREFSGFFVDGAAK